MESISIAPMSRRNSITLLICGALFFALSLLLGQTPSLKPVAFCLGVVACSALFFGIIKRQDPPTTLKLSPQGLTFQHRKGQWYLPWEQIQRLDLPKLIDGYRCLDFVGLRLRTTEPHIAAITPRLALALLMEQRPLQQLAQPCEDGNCTPTISDSRNGLTGVMAAYVAQLEVLRSGYGFDLYIPRSMMDRSPKQMLILLKQYREQALIAPNTAKATAASPPPPG
ncbi:DUF2982 domain-containing protein [Ferrimonas pelagia]|uniref:DUF2982 domain-containing protein n=1 Tax=Ferrimonas pelagia TaxID=1177826 RepID=A0ABP9EF56_9GAMM